MHKLADKPCDFFSTSSSHRHSERQSALTVSLSCHRQCPAMQIQYKTSWGELKTEKPWLTLGQKLRIGVTSGASTPDRDVEDVLDRVFKIMVPGFSGIPAKEVGPPPKPGH